MTQSSTLGGQLATGAFDVATGDCVPTPICATVATLNAAVARCPPSVEDWVMATSGLLPPSNRVAIAIRALSPAAVRKLSTVSPSVWLYALMHLVRVLSCLSCVCALPLVSRVSSKKTKKTTNSLSGRHSSLGASKYYRRSDRR